ncbi:MAG TPA: RidA family protein [Gaiellales bacterium]|jgi:2-iminobutanoate/2-iminopropanoate deaminase|nr:RidA family protein [Gaiellales bacterium]
MREPVTGSIPMGAYSPGIVAEGRFVYVAGQGPFRDGAVVSGTIEEETRLTIQNLSGVLAQAGSGLEHVVRCGVYLVDVGDFDAMNRVYAELFPDPKPARTTIGAALAGGIKVEIDCVAVVPA